MRIRAGVLALFLSVLILPAAAFADCLDYPDPYYEDINGDGIDGDTSVAVFVSASAGNDANPGTMSSPVATIPQGIVRALGAGRTHVYVAGGTYGQFLMTSGISLYGQYDGPPGWGRSDTNTTTIDGNGASAAVVAQNIGAETHLEGFTLTATTSPGQRTSYGIQVQNGSGNLYIRYNTILPGAGVDGLPGMNGSPGANGLSGGPGFPAICGGPQGGGGSPGGSTCGRVGVVRELGPEWTACHVDPHEVKVRNRVP